MFRRFERVYVAVDRDAVDKGIALAREFGVRGRIVMPPKELGAKGDLNDWLCQTAKGDPEAFKRLLGAAMTETLTPWALLIERLPAVPRRRLWEIEDEIKQLLADLAPLSLIFGIATCCCWLTRRGCRSLRSACREVADPTLEDRATTATAPSSWLYGSPDAGAGSVPIGRT